MRGCPSVTPAQGRCPLPCILALLHNILVVQGKTSQEIVAKVSYLWPIHFSSVPLSTKDKNSLEPPSLGTELAAIGLARYEDYRNNILPLELQEDKDFEKEFHYYDHSRVNLAFGQWQRRVFSERKGIPLEELVQRAELVPKRLQGVDYTWKELYESKFYRTLRRHIFEHTRLYNKRVGYPEGSAAVGERLRILTWVEIFHKGDGLRPGSRTDSAYLMGRYFARAEKGGLKLNFEDPRGINPPFGKTFSHSVYDGNLVLYPSWVSHFITPNMYNTTVVCYCFLVYPADGRTLQWQDDRSASYIYTKPFKFPRPKA